MTPGFDPWKPLAGVPVVALPRTGADRRPVSVALGMFDGVHLGHQHVIRQARIDAATWAGVSMVVTFDPHPMAVIQPGKAPLLLQSLDQRLRAMAATGVDGVSVIRFDEDFRRKRGEAFIRELAEQVGGLRSISVGEGFQFGRGRDGDLALMGALGRELGFAVHGLAPVAIGGEVVSSTRIREALRQGELTLVAELLGRPYAIAGRVRAGDRRGRSLGYPTANLEVTGLTLPPSGVYAGRAWLGGEPWPVAMNLGHRPTVDSGAGEIRCEAHLIGYEGDLYGAVLEIELVGWIRSEQRFADMAALKEQIGRDVAAAVAMLG